MKICFTFACLIIFFLKSPAIASENSNSYLLFNYPLEGMFAVFTKVMSALKLYDEGEYAGLKIDLGQGHYFEKAYGPNWWEYYWEPIELGKITKNTMIKGYWEEERKIHASHKEFRCWSREKKHQLLKKYVHLKPHIQDELDEYIKKHFKADPVIGVHYRGTDKLRSKPKHRVPYEEVAENVELQIKKLSVGKLEKFLNKKYGKQPQINYKIFVATDEMAFLEFMLKRFPRKVIYQNAFRSSDGLAVHGFRPDVSAYQRGKEALLDALILSNCSILIRTQSSLSTTASYFNPKNLFIELK